MKPGREALLSSLFTSQTGFQPTLKPDWNVKLKRVSGFNSVSLPLKPINYKELREIRGGFQRFQTCYTTRRWPAAAGPGTSHMTR